MTRQLAACGAFPTRWAPRRWSAPVWPAMARGAAAKAAAAKGQAATGQAAVRRQEAWHCEMGHASPTTLPKSTTHPQSHLMSRAVLELQVSELRVKPVCPLRA